MTRVAALAGQSKSRAPPEMSGEDDQSGSLGRAKQVKSTTREASRQEPPAAVNGSPGLVTPCWSRKES